MSLAFDPSVYRNQWNTPWGDPKIDDALRQKWPTGKSAPLIASELAREHGIIVNGDSVLHRARRIGLPRREGRWTPETKARLRELWDSGLQYGEIAPTINAEFGTSYTRNSIAGCIDRMDLPPRRKQPTAADIIARRERERQYGRDKAAANRAQRREYWHRYYAENSDKINEKKRQQWLAANYRPLAREDIPEGQRKTLMQLGPRDCRYPIGEPNEPDFFFCGGVAAEGHPYCDGHCRVAYNLQAKCSTYGRVAA